MRKNHWGIVGGAGGAVGLGLALALLVGGCGDDCSDAIAAGKEFLDDPANLTCQSNEDCQVVSTGCHTYARGICGQAQLNRDAAASSKWKTIQAGLDDCDMPGCSQCDAALVVQCADLRCGGVR
jgi:hypothetical protein